MVATGCQASPYETEDIGKVAALICSPETEIVTRMAALFTAKHIGGDKALEALTSSSIKRHPSVLFRHEAAYVLGQMGDLRATQFLKELLLDEAEHYMVRHEAGEALAALGSSEALPVLRKFVGHPSAPLRETCQLAVKSIEDKLAAGPAEQTPWLTTDPIGLPLPEDAGLSALVDALLDVDGTSPLYKRYQALFALRKLSHAGNSEATSAIVKVIKEDQRSALFRHEVAFVLGQLQRADALAALTSVIADENEDCMVRHEAAFAIGSILSEVPLSEKTSPSPYDNAIHAIEVGARYQEPIVAESCLVALEEAAVLLKHKAPAQP